MNAVSFLPFNAGDHRIAPPVPAAEHHIPLKPPARIMDMPESQKPLSLPSDNSPKPLGPSFKEIFLHKREELRRGAEGMEAILVRQVLKAMRSTIPEPEGEEDIFGEASHATQMFKQMMDDELADKIANNSEFGIAEKIFHTHANKLTEEYAEQLKSGQAVPFGLPLSRP